MAFANISAVRTADPTNAGVAKNSFTSTDPFAIVLDVQVGGLGKRGPLRPHCLPMSYGRSSTRGKTPTATRGGRTTAA